MPKMSDKSQSENVNENVTNEYNSASVVTNDVVAAASTPVADAVPAPVGAGYSAAPVDARCPLECAAPEVFRGPDGRAHVVIGGRCMPIESRECKDAVRYILLNSEESLPTDADVRDAIARLKARAYLAPKQDIHVRVAPGADSFFLDLANEAGEVVEVTGAGWRITTEPPIRFSRSPGTQPLPHPSTRGDWRKLRPLVRLSDSAFCLFVAALAFQLQGTGAQPIMVLLGQQGTAKSTLTRQIRQLIDPRKPEVRRPPGSTRDLMVSAGQCWMLAFDNISHMPEWLSDALCMMSTGGGFGARKGHTDAEETVFDVRRPVVLNGIHDFVARDDLRDRCLFFELDPVPPSERKDERTIWRDFDRAAPEILGGLLDLCSGALKELPSVRPPELPRMADFYLWALAIERAAGWPSGTIEAAYRDQREASDADALDEPLIRGIIKVAAERQTWSGTPTALLQLIEVAIPASERGKGWPAGPAPFGGELLRVVALLGRNGTLLETGRTRVRRWVRLTNTNTAVPSPPSLGAPRSAAASTGDIERRTVMANQDFVPMIAAEPEQPPAVASPPSLRSPNSARAEHGGRNGGSSAGDGSVGDQAHADATPEIASALNSPAVLSLPSPASLPEAPASTVGGRYPVDGEGERVGGAVASPGVPRSGAKAIPNLASETNNSPAEPSPASPPSPVAASQGFIPMIVAEPDQPPAVASPPSLPSLSNSDAPRNCNIDDTHKDSDGSDGSDGSLGAEASAARSAASEMPSVSPSEAPGRPTLRDAMKRVLTGNAWNAAQVVTALEEKGWLPQSGDVHRYISQELARGTDEGDFQRVGRGVYICSEPRA